MKDLGPIGPPSSPPQAPDAGPRRLALPDGRRLAWSDLGDPGGTPAIYCHGFPSSRREAQLLDRTARAQGIRILSPDRPGYGDSDPAPERKLADWAADCAALADELGLSRFRVIGVSGGAPYALACAARLGERVAACALVAPLGPLYLKPLLDRMRWFARVNFRLARHVPRLADPLLRGPMPGLIADLPLAIDAIRGRGCNPADREVLRDRLSRSTLNATVRDAMRAGARGARQDLRLYVQPWDIELGSLSAPTDIWHGDADRIVPLAHGRWYAERLPRARLRVLPGEGHYSLPLRHSSEILGALLAHA